MVIPLPIQTYTCRFDIDSVAGDVDPEPVISLIRTIQHYFLMVRHPSRPHSYTCHQNLKRDVSSFPISVDGLSSGDLPSITSIVSLLFLAQIECENSEAFLPRILSLSESTKSFIASAVDGLRADDRVKYVEVSFGTEQQDLAERLHTELQIREELENELKRKTDEAETQLQSKDEVIIQLTATMEELTNSVSKLNEANREMEDLNRSLTAKCDQLNQSRDALDVSTSARDEAAARESELLTNRQVELEKLLEESERSRRELVTQLETVNATKSRTPDDSAAEKSLQVYKQTVETLERKVKNLETKLEEHAAVDRSESERVEQEKKRALELQAEVRKYADENSILIKGKEVDSVTISDLRRSLEQKEKTFEQFALTGGALGGEVRDRVIKTLQEQLQVREEELQFYRTERLDAQEEQRKGERLLISAIHSIALKYHEEMVSRFGEDERSHEVSAVCDPRIVTPSEEFYSQEYKSSN